VRSCLYFLPGHLFWPAVSWLGESPGFAAPRDGIIPVLSQTSTTQCPAPSRVTPTPAASILRPSGAPSTSRSHTASPQGLRRKSLLTLSLRAVSLPGRLTDLPLDTAMDTRDASNVALGGNRANGARVFFTARSRILLACLKTGQPLLIRHDAGILLFNSRRVIIAALNKDFACAVGKGFDAITGN